MNKKINLLFPQWQGGSCSHDLFKGAFSIYNYLKEKVDFVHIPVSADLDLNFKNNIYGYETILSQIDETGRILTDAAPEKIFTIGGDCGIEVPIVSYLNNKYDNMDIFWFDAHGDLNTPLSSPSHYYHGMPLRFLTEYLTAEISNCIYRINHDSLFLIGTRDLDNEEIKYIKENRIKVINPDKISILENKFRKDKYAYIHIDLDVLDPSEYTGVKCPVKGGLTIENLNTLINLINKNYKIIGLSILENTETNHVNLSKLDRIFEFGINV